MSEKKIRLLFVDDEEKFLESTSQRLTLRGLEVTACTNGPDALKAADTGKFDVALLDLKMPGMDGEQVLKRLKESHPNVEVVILTGHGSIDSAVDTMRQGAYEFLQKPCELDDLINVISKAYAKRIKAKQSEKAVRVEAILADAVGLSPIEILNRLKKLDAE